MIIIDQKTIFLASFLFAFICSFLAKKSCRNPYTWFLSGFFFGIFSLLTLVFLNYMRAKNNLQKQAPPPPPNFAYIPHNEYLWYYLNGQEKAIGPMSLQKLFEEYKKGKIQFSTYLWHDQMADWRKLQEINEIKNAFTKTL